MKRKSAGLNTAGLGALVTAIGATFLSAVTWGAVSSALVWRTSCWDCWIVFEPASEGSSLLHRGIPVLFAGPHNSGERPWGIVFFELEGWE